MATGSAGKRKLPAALADVGLSELGTTQGREIGMKKSLDRRTFLRGTTALVAASPFAGLLGSTGALAQDAANPFGVAEGSTVDAVIFNGGYGIDYVEFAANLMQQNHPSVTVKVSPSTQIAQELQPRFLGGNPPDLMQKAEETLTRLFVEGLRPRS